MNKVFVFACESIFAAGNLQFSLRNSPPIFLWVKLNEEIDKVQTKMHPCASDAGLNQRQRDKRDAH